MGIQEFPSNEARWRKTVCVCAMVGVWLLLLASAPASAQTCMTWVEAHSQIPAPGSSPGQRVHHAMAYDSDRGVIVFFGGETGTSGDETYYDDTWEYDGHLWKPINTPVHPYARSLHSMAYDPVSKRVFLYGGFAGGRYGFDDTWTYRSDGTNGFWDKVGSGNVEARGFVGTGMAWDGRRQTLVRGGGIDNPFDERGPFGVIYSGSTVHWTGSAWELLSDRDPELWGVGFAYDSNREVSVMAGGYSCNHYYGDPDTCRSGAVSEFLPDGVWVTQPTGIPARAYPAMAYDSDRKRLVVVGGHGNAPGSDEQVFEYVEGAGWIQGTPLKSGYGRSGAAMVYDSKRKVMVLMGGAGGGAERSVPGDVDRGAGSRWSDTWELKYAGALRFSNFAPETPETNYCSTDPIHLDVSFPGGCDPVLYQWFRNGVAIPGQTNRPLALGPGSLVFGAHTLSVVARDASGMTASSQPINISIHTVPNLRVNEPVLPPGASTTFPYPGLDTRRFYVCPGDAVSLAVRIVSTQPILGSEWSRNDKLVKTLANPESLDTLTLTDLKPIDSGRYTVRVWNRCGSTYLTLGELQVGPVINLDPQGGTKEVGNFSRFFVQADGKGTLRYQWLLDGAPLADDTFIKGASTTNLLVGPLLYTHAGNYAVVVTDACGPLNSVTSKVANLTITPGPQWLLRSTNGPAPREGAAIAYDDWRKVTVLFGGVGVNPRNTNVIMTFNDLWEWNGSRWTERQPNTPVTNGWSYGPAGWKINHTATQPIQRRHAAMTFDSRRGRSVLYGGATWQPGYGEGSGAWWEEFFNDMWEWDGGRWERRTTNGPTARFHPGLAYDRKRFVSVLYGGRLGAGATELDTVWEWNGAEWSPTKTPPFDATLFTPGPSMVWDSFRGAVTFGPIVECLSISLCPLRSFWAWQDQQWIKQTGGFDPAVPMFAGTVFDDYRRRLIHFGGQHFGPTSATWSWDGLSWESLPLTNGPAARIAPAAAYDSDRHAMVMFGGSGQDLGPFLPNETWELVAVDKPLFLDQPVSQAVQPGATATLSSAAVLPRTAILIAVRLFKDGQEVSSARAPLTVDFTARDNLRWYSFNYVLTNVAAEDLGEYVIEVSNACGTSTTPPAILSFNAPLQIFSSKISDTNPAPALLQLVWTDPNVVLEEALNPAGPWTPVPAAASPFNVVPAGSGRFFRLRPL